MARIARIVIPDHPHLVTQRGNRREPVFFEEADYGFYTELIFSAAKEAGCQIWAYCWMPNHTHTIIVPCDEDGLRKTFADAHRQYTRHINARLGVTGHLWQGRYGSVVMDENTLIEAVRYVSLNPVRAGLVSHPKDWRWSSANRHLNNQDEGAFDSSPIRDRIPDFAHLMTSPPEDNKVYAALRTSETTGRPVGSPEWIKGLEKQTGRSLLPAKRGPKPNGDKTSGSKTSGQKSSSSNSKGLKSTGKAARKNQWSVW